MTYNPNVLSDLGCVSFNIRDDNGMWIGEAITNDSPFDGCMPVTISDAEKNAMLWAAAPDLLDALQRILSDYDIADHDEGPSMAALLQAENAIKKACGQLKFYS